MYTEAAEDISSKPKTESEKPQLSGVAKVKKQINRAFIANADRAGNMNIGERVRQRALDLHEMQGWQMDMLEYFAREKAHEDGVFKQESIDAIEASMTANEAWGRLDKWLESYENSEEEGEPDEFPKTKVRAWAEDLKSKLDDEAGQEAAKEAKGNPRIEVLRKAKTLEELDELLHAA